MTDLKKRKFKIMYPQDYWDKKLAGEPYIPLGNAMIVMNGGGVFFIIKEMGTYQERVMKLSEVLYKYDVVWKN